MTAFFTTSLTLSISRFSAPERLGLSACRLDASRAELLLRRR